MHWTASACAATAAAGAEHYENRVYQVGIEDDKRWWSSFYRPGRWKRRGDPGGHGFTQELPRARSRWSRGRHGAGAGPGTLHRFNSFRFAVFARHGGRAPESAILGAGVDRPLHARIHAVGAIKPYQQRPPIDSPPSHRALRVLQANQFIPADLKEAYASVSPRRSTACAAATTRRRTAAAAPARRLPWRQRAVDRRRPDFVDLTTAAWAGDPGPVDDAVRDRRAGAPDERHPGRLR